MTEHYKDPKLKIFSLSSNRPLAEKIAADIRISCLNGEVFAELESSSEIESRQLPGPVSYTHLRAHETVLDLVCRLLLEKKKNKKKKNTKKE